MNVTNERSAPGEFVSGATGGRHTVGSVFVGVGLGLGCNCLHVFHYMQTC